MTSSQGTGTGTTATGTTAANVLVVDLARILDESALGKQGAAQLQAKFDEARSRFDKLLSRGTSESGKRMAEGAAAAFQAEALAELERERARLREEVLAKVRPIVAALMSERKAALVVDAAACLAIGANVDVTDDVLRRL